jgi:uncharacterized protein
MAPTLSEDEIDDLIYTARTGENDDLTTLLASLAEREKVSPAEILSAAKDEGKSTSLHMAAANGHLGISPSLPLTHFSSNKLAETVTLLLSHFPPTGNKKQKQDFLDAPNEYGNTALHWAALSGHLPVVKKLVEAGASVAIANDKNYVPLDLAASNEKRDVVDYFLEQSGMLEETNGEEGLRVGLEGVDVDGEEGDDFEEGEEGEKAEKGRSS